MLVPPKFERLRRGLSLRIRLLCLGDELEGHLPPGAPHGTQVCAVWRISFQLVTLELSNPVTIWKVILPRRSR